MPPLFPYALVRPPSPPLSPTQLLHPHDLHGGVHGRPFPQKAEHCEPCNTRRPKIFFGAVANFLHVRGFFAMISFRFSESALCSPQCCICSTVETVSRHFPSSFNDCLLAARISTCNSTLLFASVICVGTTTVGEADTVNIRASWACSSVSFALWRTGTETVTSTP